MLQLSRGRTERLLGALCCNMRDASLTVASLAAWTIVGVPLVIALILLGALGWMEGVYSTELKPSSAGQQK